MYGVTRLIPPLNVTASLNQFVVDEGGGAVTVSVSAQFYWGHRDSTTDATYAGLYKAVEDALNASGSLSNTYAFEVHTPELSHRQLYGGLALRATAGGNAFSVDFTNAAFTLPVEWFGMLDNTVVSASDVSSVTEGSEEVAYFPYCRGAEWLTYNIFSWRGATDQRSETEHDIQSSDPDPLYAYEYDWSNTSAGNRDRMFEVPHIPAAHIKGNRALNAGYARAGELAHGDENNALQDIFWDRARILRGEGTDSDFLVVYNDASDLQVSTHDWDACRLADRDHRAKFENMLTLESHAPEYYSLKTRFRVKTMGYEH